MDKAVWPESLLCFFLLSLHTVYSSGILVGFSYDAREQGSVSWSPTEALSFLQRNRIPTSHFKLLLRDPEALIDSLRRTNIPADLCLRETESKKLLKSRASATSWLKSYLTTFYPTLNISSILVSSSKESLPLLPPTLQLIQESLNTFNLHGSVKVSAMFSLSAIDNLDRTQHKRIQRIMHSIRNLASFAVVEAHVDGETNSLDAFLVSTIQSALSACAALPYLDIPIVLQIKPSISLSGVGIGNLTERVMQFITGHALLKQRISGLFFDISQLREYKQKDLHREEGLIISSSHRELLNHGRGLKTSTKTILHDTITPITYPSITPITVPATNPAPAVVTVPSTNPVTVVPTNPTMAPVTISPINPVTTPITVPMTNPLPTPAATPVVPVTNPATTPTTNPTNPPTTNPVTTSPSTPTWSTPSITPPVTVPSTYPVTPAATGQTWCIAKSGITDAALQIALDYACGVADCSALQPTGSCYNPNTLQAHASYAFNSYYQRNPVATSCDFGGTAMLINVNPSTATCIFSSSSSVPNSNPVSNNPASASPASTTGSGSSVFNTNNPGSSSSVFGSSNPTGYTSNSFSLSAGWTFLVYVLTVAYISRKF